MVLSVGLAGFLGVLVLVAITNSLSIDSRDEEKGLGSPHDKKSMVEVGLCVPQYWNTFLCSALIPKYLKKKGNTHESDQMGIG